MLNLTRLERAQILPASGEPKSYMLYATRHKPRYFHSFRKALHVLAFAGILFSGLSCTEPAEDTNVPQEEKPASAIRTPPRGGSKGGGEPAALEFIEACRWKAGTTDSTLGSGAGGEERPVNVNGIFWQLQWEILMGKGRPDERDRAHTAFIRKCLNPDGGYGLWPGDPSSGEATACAVRALVLMDTMQEGIPAPLRTIAFLESAVKDLTKRLTLYSDWIAEDALGECLLALRSLGGKPVEFVMSALDVLAGQRMSRGPYWYVACAEAFGVPVEGAESLKQRLADAIKDHGDQLPWELDEQAFAVMLIRRLHGRDTPKGRERIITRGIQTLYSHVSGSLDFAERYRNAYMAEQTNRFFKLGLWWSGKVPAAGPLVELFAQRPNLLPDSYATQVALDELVARGIKVTPSKKLLEKLKGLKVLKDGALVMDKPGWRATKLMVVLKTVSYFRSLGVAIPEPARVAEYLREAVNAEMKSASLAQIAEAMEHYFALAEDLPEAEETDFPGLENYLAERPLADAAAVARIRRALGKSESHAPALAKRLVRQLDRFAGANRSMDLADAARCVGGLDALGKLEVLSANGLAEKLRRRIDGLQNPDGGYHRPRRIHSDLYQTVAALHIMRLLPAPPAKAKGTKDEEIVQK